MFSDSAVEKSTTKRPLSAPEYLEKRKQERRKSELNLNRTLKLKKNLKKVIHYSILYSYFLFVFSDRINFKVSRKKRCFQILNKVLAGFARYAGPYLLNELPKQILQNQTITWK